MKAFVCCLLLLLPLQSHAAMGCVGLCADDIVKLKIMDKTLHPIPPSRQYHITGRIISVKPIYPHGGPPRVDKCYAIYRNNGRQYHLVTVALSAVAEKSSVGDTILGLEQHSAPEHYYSFAVDDKNNFYANAPQRKSIREADAIEADVVFSGDECLAQPWLSNLQFLAGAI